MPNSTRSLLAAVAFLLATNAAGLPGVSPDEAPALRVERVDLFKNGLAVVRASGAIDRSGVATYAVPPTLVHGSLWARADHPLEIRSHRRSVPTPTFRPSRAELLESALGHDLVVHLGDEVLEGTLVGQPDDAPPPEPVPRLGFVSPAPRGPSPGDSMLLRTRDGRFVAFGVDRIERLEFAEPPVVRRPKDFLELRSEDPGAFELEWIGRGMSWAPSYRIDLSDPETLVLRQKAVIRNEMRDLESVEIGLISGFPSVSFATVDALVSPGQTWSTFFEQLEGAGRGGGSRDIRSNAARQWVAPTSVDGPALGAAEPGEGVDLHVETVGRHDLRRGETLVLPVAEATASYETVVEWIIPDLRRPDGRPVDEHVRRQDPERYEESAWDAIRFVNPFAFPLTTAPAVLVRKGGLRALQQVSWTSPGERTAVRVTKALSVGTRAVEAEVPETRRDVVVTKTLMQSVEVQGSLSIANRRAEPVVVIARRRFSGALLEADAEPTTRLLESGVTALNPRNELMWRLEVEAGGEREVGYRYEVLVPR